MKLTDPAAVEIAGSTGFDFVILDQEHGPVSTQRLQDLIRAAELSGTCPVVRVPSNAEESILQALDIGAGGVEAPQIRDRECAERMVRYSRFHPKGDRGMCRYVRAARYSGIPGERYFSEANDSVVTIGHVEGMDGIENIESICEVGGLDVVFLGPYDLSQSCGVPGQTSHPKVVEAMSQAVEIAKRNGVVVGTFVESLDDLLRWKKLGVQYIAFSVDVGIFYRACAELINRIRNEEGASLP